MLIAQITDSHIKAKGKLAYQKVDTEKNLRRCVDHVRKLEPLPDIVLFTGDLTDFGRPEEYALFRQLLAPLEMPVYVIPGNHDTREGLRQAFTDHHYLPDQGTYINYTVEHYPLRLIGLDTTVPGRPEGNLCAERLSWLDRQLQLEPDKPTVLFMHHPPIKTGIEHMDVQNCGNGEALGDLLSKHRQVFQILCGHVHRPIHQQWRGVTVTIAPSASHYVALDLKKGSPADFNLEPPTVQLHQWRNDNSLISHLSFIGSFDGPHPFFDADGNLID
ncbi:phosphodiesterase [Chromatiales bacterium (ex Bugula neritina AB1)]|nr:phosphodiesterase [Chromatiales bacterium (ex Bugula neritina AB1)]